MIQKIEIIDELPLYFIGPPLEVEAKATVFYFALSAKESLEIDPYNEPAIYLSKEGIRVFSVDLPFHGMNLSAIEAIERWAEALQNGKDPLTPFFHQVEQAILRLVEKKWISPNSLGFMGLSRGGFIACHMAAKLPFVKFVLGFAPLTHITSTKELRQRQLENDPTAQRFDLPYLNQSLYDRTMRFYIGNRDERVHTPLCFEWINGLVEEAFQRGIRTAPIELIIRPSIGHLGHGTPPSSFLDGAKWLFEQFYC